MNLFFRPNRRQCGALLFVAAAVWGTSVTWAQEARKRFATVERIAGPVQAIDLNTQRSRNLSLGDVVYTQERVQAGPGAEALLRTDDGGAIAVRPTSAFAMERFSAEGAGKDRWQMRIFQGGMRMVTGAIGQRSRESYQVTTPTATMGVRGTDYEPYVITADMAVGMRQEPGTYNRVYSGATSMDSGGDAIEVRPGQVGFAAPPPASSSRGLMTVLVPVILERVPDFFVPGRFDAQLAAFITPTVPNNLNSPATPAATSASSAEALPAQEPDRANCAHQTIARQWLQSLDQAIIRRDTAGFIALFEAQADVRVMPRQGDPIVINRETLARSTLTTMQQLTEFSSERPMTRSRPLDGNAREACTRIAVDSRVAETGVRNGQRYQMETLERYELRLQDGQWKANRAATSLP